MTRIKHFNKKFNISLRWAFMLTAIILLSSCGRYEEINITNVSDINIKGFDNNALLVSLNMEVDNPSLHRIKITDFDTRLFMDNNYIGKLTVDNDVVLKAKSHEIYQLDLRIRVANFLGTAMSLMSLKPGQKLQIRIEGTVTARTKLMKKLIDINEIREVVI